MATFICPQESDVCSICYEKCKAPRKLPGCLHKFCEKCLMTYISNLKSNDTDLADFQCPNCRRQVPLPTSTGDLKSWVERLEDDDSMATNAISRDDKALCLPCKAVEKAVAAEEYCIECRESLCGNCSRIRHGTRLLEGHLRINLQDTFGQDKNNDQEELIRILSEVLKCDKHPDKTLSHLCKVDGSLCCTDCAAEDFRQCTTIASLKDEKGKLTDSEEKQVKEQMKRIASQLEILCSFKKTYIAEMKQEPVAIANKLHELRTNLNTVLDNLEAEVSSKAKAYAKKYALEAENEMSNLRDIEKNLKMYMSLIDYSKSLGSFSQWFIVLEKLKSKMNELERDILKTSETSRSVHKIDLNVGPVLKTLSNVEPNDTSKIMSVTESYKHLDIPGIQIKNTFTGRPLHVTEHIVLPEESGCGNPNYCSIGFCKENIGVFLLSTCINHQFCCLTNNNYQPVKCYSIKRKDLAGKPFRATCLANNEIAVSLPENRRIVFLSDNNSSNQIEISTTITTKYMPRALCGLKNGDIAVSWIAPVGFSMLRTKRLFNTSFEERVYFQQDTTGRKLKTFDYMAIDEKRSHVIQPCTEETAIFCFDFEGHPQFKYTHADLVFPSGVSISSDGNVFACDVKKSVIHVISPEGVGQYVIREECPREPLDIAFDQSGMRFAVSQKCFSSN